MLCGCVTRGCGDHSPLTPAKQMRQVSRAVPQFYEPTNLPHLIPINNIPTPCTHSRTNSQPKPLSMASHVIPEAFRNLGHKFTILPSLSEEPGALGVLGLAGKTDRLAKGEGGTGIDEARGLAPQAGYVL